MGLSVGGLLLLGCRTRRRGAARADGRACFRFLLRRRGSDDRRAAFFLLTAASWRGYDGRVFIDNFISPASWRRFDALFAGDAERRSNKG